MPLDFTSASPRTVCRRATLLALLITAPAVGQQPQASWSVDATPLLTLGTDEADPNGVFAVVVGATRLPDGRILVGDRGDFSLHLFSPEGKHLRAFGRKGAGPGEIGYLITFLRCGDSVATLDIHGSRVSMFSLDGRHARSFRFGSAEGRSPYRSVCNGDRVFAHFGWESPRDFRSGPYRPAVPFWLSGPDSLVRTVIGTFPGSERYGQRYGTRPLALGRQPDIALSADRLYIGTADRYEIMMFDLSGRRVGTIRGPDVDLRTTKDDIAYAKARELSMQGNEQLRRSVERDYAEMAFPETVPAYASLRVDADDYLWVQDYPRVSSPTARWSVFTAQGARVAEVALPTHLEVYEIGGDYVLGRFLDPDESIPQVRLYRLRRPSAAR